jgi:hypothetical protein
MLEDVEVPVEIVAAEQQRELADFLGAAARGTAAKRGQAVIGHADDRRIGARGGDVRNMIHGHEWRNIAIDPRHVVWPKRFSHALSSH